MRFAFVLFLVLCISLMTVTAKWEMGQKIPAEEIEMSEFNSQGVEVGVEAFPENA